MDQATKHKLSVIVLRTLLYEILKKGKVHASEKQIFQKVLKTLKLPQDELVTIQKEVKNLAKSKPENKEFDAKLFLKRLKDELEDELSSSLIRKFIVKISKLVSPDKHLIDEYIPTLFKDHQVGAVQPQDLIEAADKNDLSDSDNIEDSPLSNNFYQSDIDPIEILRTRIPDQSIKYFNNVVSLKSQGEHNTAIELLLDYSVPLDFDTRYYLLSRLYYEIHFVEKSEEYLSKASKAGLANRIIDIERYFHTFESLELKNKINFWKDLNHYESDSETTIESLVKHLKCRNRNILALELIELIQNDDTKFGNLNDSLLLKFFNDLLSKTFVDIYFRYYGMTIIALQLAASVLVLSICFYNIGYIGPALKELLHQMVAGISDQQIFYDSLNKILPFTFLVIALVPVCYINGIMIWAGLQKKTKSYAQVHDDFIKICDFGKIYHLSLSKKEKPLFLYQDDNDYTYVSLVRHLPFVPNFTYVYGYDHLRGIYCLLPLYGVADGYLFSKTFLNRVNCKVHSINMLGVRLAQASTVIAKLSRTYLVVLPLILIMGVFFYANINFAQDASFESYLTTFLLFLFIVVGIIILPMITIKWLTTVYINRILMVNIIKPGLMLLVGLYLIQHYQHFGISGLVPIIVCLYSFYLLFIRTKYPPEKKQIVAQISASSDMVNKTKRSKISESWIEGDLSGK